MRADRDTSHDSISYCGVKNDENSAQKKNLGNSVYLLRYIYPYILVDTDYVQNQLERHLIFFIPSS
jgi:hypothetical protein